MKWGKTWNRKKLGRKNSKTNNEWFINHNEVKRRKGKKHNIFKILIIILSQQ